MRKLIHQVTVGIVVLLSCVCFNQAFIPGSQLQLRSRSRSSSSIQMIFGGLGGGGQQGIPRSIKDGVTELRYALQRALKDRQSRMMATLPRNVALGVEAPNLDKGGDVSERTDRELGRLFVEMFKPIIDQTVVIFPDNRQVIKAKNIWGTDIVKVISFDEVAATGSAKKKKGKKAGFASDPSANILPPDTQVVIVVAPGARELSIVSRLSDRLGMDTAIILLNCPKLDTVGLNKDDQISLQKSFQIIFHLTPLTDKSVNTQDNILLYRSYPGEWKIAQKLLGPPKVLLEKKEMFTNQEMLDALRKGAENNNKPLMEKLTGIFG